MLLQHELLTDVYEHIMDDDQHGLAGLTMDGIIRTAWADLPVAARLGLVTRNRFANGYEAGPDEALRIQAKDDAVDRPVDVQAGVCSGSALGS